MNEETITTLTLEECIAKLKDIREHASGSTDGIKMKLRKFCLYPKLYERLKLKSQRSYKFKCSLNPLDVPQISAKWNSSETPYPIVNEAIFITYCSFKHQGNHGQQEKAFHMLQSRKIVSVKSLQETNELFVKAMIKKSYGTQIRPAVVLFHDSIPETAHCSCPVGLSGLCCYVLVVLLYLKHYSDKRKAFRVDMYAATAEVASQIKKRLHFYGSSQ